MTDGIQSCAYLLELSPDWVVLRASENIHQLLGQSHVTLIDEPLGKFTHSQALHDVRNLFSRLSGTTGIGRAYGIRLSNDPMVVDIAFQQAGGRVLLEAVPSAGRFGEAFGTVGGLIAGLSGQSGQALVEGAARRMRALSGFDRVSLRCDGRFAHSSRGTFAGASALDDADLPAIVADSSSEAMPIFPRGSDSAVAKALTRAADSGTLAKMAEAGVRSALCLPFSAGEFRCENLAPRPANFETHAAAELFAQMFALQLEMDALKSADQFAK